MAVRSTPIFIDGNTHPAEETRLAVAALLGSVTGSFTGGATAADRAHGIVNAGDLAVSQNGTPNMSVNVATGGCFIRGTENANQGSYHLWNDATVNLAITAADATNPRRDLIIAQVRDAYYSGSSKDARITVVTGTPAASPSDPSLSSFPNALVLARVAVAANATSVTTANITDLRPRASALGGVEVCTSTRRPASPNVGEMIYETDTGKNLVYYGATTGWQPPWGQPWGVVGHFSTSTTYSRNSNTTAEINTAFRLSVSTFANRRLLLTFRANLQNVDAGGTIDFYNNTTAATLGRAFQDNDVLGTKQCDGSLVIDSSASTTVYTMRWASVLVTFGVVGTISTTTASPTQFTIEDIGPATSTAPTA